MLGWDEMGLLTCQGQRRHSEDVNGRHTPLSSTWEWFFFFFSPCQWGWWNQIFCIFSCITPNWSCLFHWHSTESFVYNTELLLSVITILFSGWWPWISANILMIFPKNKQTKHYFTVSSTYWILKCNLIRTRDCWVSDGWESYSKPRNGSYLYLQRQLKINVQKSLAGKLL